MRQFNSKKFNLIIFVFFTMVFITLAVCSSSNSQDESSNPGFDSKEFFFVDPLAFFNTDKSEYRLDVYIEIPMQNLTFKRFTGENGGFEADFDFSVKIKDPNGENIINESYSSAIKNTVTEHQNVSNMSEFIMKNYQVNPGFYIMEIVVTDKNTYKTHSKDFDLNLNPVEIDNISFSDFMLLSNYDESNPDRKVITPLVNNNVGNLNDFFVFFEIYNRGETALMESFEFVIKDSEGNEFRRMRNSYYLQPGVNQKVEKFSSQDLLVGNFNLDIVNAKSQQKYQTKNFDFKWDFFPSTIEDLDLAIRQTLYIASSDEYDKMRSAKTPAQKQKAFMEFWKSKDPNPNTSYNEKMANYYQRVRIADERYSHYFDGWRTDMGMIYIMYGDPSSIERHPFSETSKPYEIWEYYNISRRFVFVDNTGFGDYRLTTPVWDDRTRLRF